MTKSTLLVSFIGGYISWNPNGAWERIQDSLIKCTLEGMSSQLNGKSHSYPVILSIIIYYWNMQVQRAPQSILDEIEKINLILHSRNGGHWISVVDLYNKSLVEKNIYKCSPLMQLHKQLYLLIFLDAIVIMIIFDNLLLNAIVRATKFIIFIFFVNLKTNIRCNCGCNNIKYNYICFLF